MAQPRHPDLLGAKRLTKVTSRVHERFRYRLAGEVGSTKVMLAGKAESQKDRAEALHEVTLGANSTL